MVGKEVQFYLVGNEKTEFVIEDIRVNDRSVVPDLDWKGRIGEFQRYNFATVKIQESDSELVFYVNAIEGKSNKGRISLFANFR